MLPSQFVDWAAWPPSPPQSQDPSLDVGASAAEEVVEQGVVVMLVIQKVSVAASVSSGSSVVQSSGAFAWAEVTGGV